MTHRTKYRLFKRYEHCNVPGSIAHVIGGETGHNLLLEGYQTIVDAQKEGNGRISVRTEPPPPMPPPH
jgi:hypothetical protein